MADEAKNEETSQEEPQGVEYANFDDMVKSEIPDEIEVTPAKSNQAIDYFEEEVADEPETAEEAEPRVNHKGETLTPEQESYWQSKYDTDIKAANQQNEQLRQEIDGIKTQLNPPQKEEPLVAPVAPQTDDPNDWVDYLKAKDEYNTKLLDQKFQVQDNYFQQIEQERQERQQAEQANQLKSYQLGKLQTAGRLTPEESVEAIAMFSKAVENEDEYFQDLASFYLHRKGKSTQPKPTNSNQTPAPLAVQSGEAEATKVDETDQFFGDMNNFIHKHY